MPAFHEVLFPEGIAYGAVGGPKFKTTVLQLASGHEKRNIDWARSRAEYDVAHGLRTTQEFDEIRSFFYARRGKAYGFRFKDWLDHKLDWQGIGITDGTTRNWQVFKRYQSGDWTYDRPLPKLVQNTISVVVGGTAAAMGPGTGNYTVDVNTGIITLGTDLAATVDQDIIVTTEFHVPVRFDTDHLAASLDEYNVQSWGQIMIVEVRL